MHGEFSFYSPDSLLVGAAKLERERNYREKQVPRSIQTIFRRMSANVYRCLALFAENPDYVPLPLAPFGANRVPLQRKKCCQQIIGLNDESFSIAVCIDAKK